MEFDWRFWRRRGPRHHLRGRLGEDHAARYLQSWGLRVVERNVLTRFGEIDLVVDEPPGSLLFVEVKARSPKTLGRPSRSVDRAKQRRLSRAADVFLLRHPQYRQRACRFDVVEVFLDHRGQVAHVEWIRKAFEYVRRPR